MAIAEWSLQTPWSGNTYTTNSIEWKSRLYVYLTKQESNKSYLDIYFQWTRTRQNSYGSTGATNYTIIVDGVSYSGVKEAYNINPFIVDDWKDIAVKYSVPISHVSGAAKSIEITGQWGQTIQPTYCKVKGTINLPAVATKPTGTTFTVAATSNGKIDLGKIAQGEYKLTAQATGATGDSNYSYQYAYSVNSGAWTYIDWTTTNYLTHNTSNFNQGDIIEYTAMGANCAGNSPWSEYVKVTVNKVPAAPVNIWLENNNKYPIGSIKILWNPGIDPNAHNVKHELQYKTTSIAWTSLVTGNITEYLFDISAHSLGTIYDFRVRAIDSLNGYSTWKDLLTACYKSAAPQVTTITLNKSGIVEGYITATAKCSDSCYPSNISYEIFYKIDDGEWTLGSSTSNTYTKNLATCRGQVCTFRARALNTAGVSPWSEEVSVTSNNAPTPVTNIMPNVTYVDGIINMTWDASTDIEHQYVKYEISLSKNNGAYAVLSTVTTASYKWTVPSIDLASTWYYFSIVAIDSLDGRSVVAQKIYKKAIPPTKPSALSPNTAGTYSRDFVISWKKSDFATLSGKYIVLILLNGATYKTYEVDSSITSVNVSIAELTQGATLKIGVQAVNEYNQSSAISYSSAAMKINSVPTAPSIIYPIVTTKEYYGDNVRLQILAGTDNESAMYMHVTINGYTYSSNNSEHIEYFSLSEIYSGEIVLFKKEILDDGPINIKVFASDGFLQSSTVNFTLNKRPVNLINVGDEITASVFDTIASAIGNNRTFYNLSDTSYLGEVLQEDYITAEKAIALNNALKEMHYKIDNTGCNNGLPYTDLITSKINTGLDITAEVFNLIISNL